MSRCLGQQLSLTAWLQACRQYHKMLHRVYGPTLILHPHVMDVSAMRDYNTCGMLLLLSMVH